MHPWRFADRWVRGEQRALNPLAFLATSAAVVGAVRILFAARFRPTEPDQGLLGQMLDVLGPYAHYALLGVLAHLVFRLTASRARLRDSLGVALFAGGGPAAIAELLLLLISAVALRPEDLQPSSRASLALVVAGATVSFSVFSATFAASLAAIHRVERAWTGVLRVTAAMLVAYLLSGALHGIVKPPGHYGLHFELKLQKQDSGKWDFSLGLKA